MDKKRIPETHELPTQCCYRQLEVELLVPFRRHDALSPSDSCFRIHFWTDAVGRSCDFARRSGSRDLEAECRKIEICPGSGLAEPNPGVPAHSCRCFGHLDRP